VRIQNPTNLFDISGLKVLVTGAGQGLGREIATALHDLGATIYGTSRDIEVAKSISSTFGTPPLLLDQSKPDSIQPLVDELFVTEGGIDCLVNNAGINRPKPSLEVSEEDWDVTLDTNLKGPFFLSRAFGEKWLSVGRAGTIVNISSQAGVVAIENRSPYGASKAGLIHLTRILAAEWASNGIRVNGIAPTFIRTEMTRKTLEDPDFASLLLGRIPLGRFGEPQDLIGATVFLMSPASYFITGQTLLIDGGYTLR
jgi:NAD(P)-dependent dehydrogenase (short-subunit alcohol dehydrogenase family)